VVAQLLPKQWVAGSNPVSRSRRRRGQVVKARVCKTLITGSNPVVASEQQRFLINSAFIMKAESLFPAREGDLDPWTDMPLTLIRG
jgi:hypothetical protein